MGPNGTMPQRRAIWEGSRGLVPRKRGEVSRREGTTPLLLLLAFASLAGCSPPANDFHEHQIISPRLYHGRTKREVESSHSKEEEGGHAHHLTVAWVDTKTGKDIVVDLNLNRDLIPESYAERYHHQGNSVVNKPLKSEVELCHYTGSLRGAKGSWAALSTCDGVEGVLYDGSTMHHIARLEQPELASHLENPHYVYSESHLKETNHTCGFHDTPGYHEHESPEIPLTTEPFFAEKEFNRMLRYKRDISSASGTSTAKNNKIDVKGPWNANKRSRYVELVIVVDNRKYKEFGKDLQKVYKKCKDMANIANALYAPLNIYIALVGVDVWSEYDEITLSTNGDTTLTNFLHYRRERLVKQFPNDNAQLLTGIQFDSGVVGKALKGPICTYEFSGGVSMWHSEVIGLVATTMAHELGHNFGMEHDSESCECPDDRCIMAPASSTMKPSFWSSCSLEYLALAFEHGMDYCLRNKPRTLFEGPVCGNGFVEPGEECDCGLKEHCDNPCCNPTTCRLHPNATCATGECCDFKTCKPKSPGNICRLAEHECDLPEFCTGDNEFCPKDIFKVDGVTCKVGQAFCYQGTCRSHSDQCRLLWGPSGKKSDNQCYEQNRKGSRHGNCGYNRLNQSYIPCVEPDVRCGMLHCQHLNERLEFGMESVAILSHSFINSGGKIIPCRTALVDLGIDDVDPGLAPEGARCGEDSLCVNQKCMPVANLKIGPLSCPNNCNGHGVCNSLGHCHCDSSWAPPYCESPGAGGSLDSGPASDPNTGGAISTYLYVFFFFILPLIVAIACVAYYAKGGDIQTLVKKTKPDTGFISVERHRGKSRPPSRLGLDSKDISGPVSVEGAVSSSSSPTHALLPRSTTETSQISFPAGGGASTAGSEAKQGAGGRFAVGMLTGLAGFPRRKSGDCSVGASPPDSLTAPESGDTVQIHRAPSYRDRTRNLLKSINKSISFPALPSPKFRNVDNNKYEVRIEPRQVEELSPAEEKEGVVGPQSPTSPSKPPVIPISHPTTNPPISSLRGGKSSTLPATLAVSPTQVEKVETRVVLESSEPSSKPISPQYDPKNNPKLAFGSFPQSSSFTNATVASTEASLAASLSSGSISAAKAKLAPTRTTDRPGWKRPNPSSYINRNATAAAAPTPPFTSNVKPLQSPFLQSSAPPVKPTSTVTVSPFSQLDSKPKTLATSKPSTSSPDASKASTPSPLAAKPPPPPPASAKPTLPASKPEPAVKPASKPSSTVSQSDRSPDKKSPSSPITTTKPAPPPKASTLPSSPDRSSEKSPTIAPFKGKEGKSSTPTATVRPLISKPVLQNTTPNAASLIAKAPSTGVSQSSILATNLEKESDPFKPPRDKARRAVFSDQIILPSPTSPNTPPIIHQPHPATEETLGKVITPTWSTQPQAVVQEAQICHIEEKEGSKDSTDSSDKSTLSKLISNVKRTPSVSEKSSSKSKTGSLPRKGRPDRSSLRTLDISAPVLQSGSVEPGELLPVCRSPDSSSTSSSPQTCMAPSVLTREVSPSPRQGSPSMKRPAPPPPAAPKPAATSPEKSKSKTFLPWRGKAAKETEVESAPPKVSSSDDIQGYKRPDPTSRESSKPRRPASIATSKPIRPMAPPPKPPPSRNNSKETSPEEIYIYDDASAMKRAPLASGSDAKEPIYDTIKEVPDGEDDDDFITPVGSPVIPKKMSQDFDTKSTTSSGGEEDLMGSILKEVSVKSGEESIYSSLMRKDKRKKKRRSPETED